MNYNTERTQQQTLVLDGDCTLDRAHEFRSLLLDALKTDGDLLLNLDNATEVDLSLLQLLCAAHRSAVGCGKQLLVKSKPSTAFIEAAQGAGFLRTMGCQGALNKGCLFTEVMTNG
jgi:anti-anti-sigma regulatory factor